MVNNNHTISPTRRGGSLPGLPGAWGFALLGLLSALLAENLVHRAVHGVGDVADLLQGVLEGPGVAVGVAGRDDHRVRDDVISDADQERDALCLERVRVPAEAVALVQVGIGQLPRQRPEQFVAAQTVAHIQGLFSALYSAGTPPTSPSSNVIVHGGLWISAFSRSSASRLVSA